MERRPGRVEAVVAGDRRGPSRGAPRRPGRRRVEHAPPVELGEEPAEARIGRRRAASASGRHRPARPSRLDPTGGKGLLTTPMLSCGPTCRPASQRRQRHRRNGSPRTRTWRVAPPSRGARHPAPPLLELPRRSAASGFVGAVSAYAYYSRGLPDPADALENLTFEQQSRRLRPDRQDRARPARRAPARARHVRRHPARDDRRDDRDRGQGLLDEPGLRPRRRSSPPALDTLAGQPARRARRSPSSSSAPGSCPPSAFAGTVYDRKIREIIQSIRLTQAYPGEDGKQQIITAYLNQNFYGNQSYGVQAAAQGVLRQGARRT